MEPHVHLAEKHNSTVTAHIAAIEIKRIQISIRLQNDLRINLAGTALALDLLEEIEDLKRSKQQLEHLHALESS
jgi:hypothetical protein